MLSFDDITKFAANSTYGLKVTVDHNDRWKFTVTMPGLDDSRLLKIINNSPYVDPSTITTTYTPGKTVASFEVTDYSFSEWLKDSIRREHDTWWYAVDHIREPINAVNTYFIKEEDNKMSTVKNQEPTWYPRFRNFKNVIRSGPVTIAWIFDKKVMIRKTKKDKDDLEKAMLMLYVKSQFSSEASFHRWFRDQMKIFEEADKNAKN